MYKLPAVISGIGAQLQFRRLHEYARRIKGWPTTVSPRRTPRVRANVSNSPRVSFIGNPAGLDFTITRGIVSGLRLDRGITLLQTDASINRGNSGGPIFDPSSAKVVGVVSWKFSGGGAEGLGFGVTIGDALRVLGVQR